MVGMRKVLITVTLLCTLMCRLNCICVDCHLPPNATNKQIEYVVIQDFKLRLMERLGMKTEPKRNANTGTLPMSIIKAIAGPDMLVGDQPSRRTQYNNKIKDIILDPLLGAKKVNNVHYFSFKVTSDLRGVYQLAGVKLWLYASKSTKRHWFQVYQSNQRTMNGRSLLLNDSINSFISEWKVFKLMPQKGWYNTPWKKLDLQIEGIDDDQGKPLLSANNNQPRLQLLTKPIKQRLTKRGTTQTTDCSGNGRCCKHTMTLSLTGHIDWLVVPQTIQALICRGSCPILHRQRWMWTYLSQMQTNRSPCCVPTKLSPVSVIYNKAEGNDSPEYVQTEVNDIIVESCGCS